jgi:hypothetical protein
LARVGSTTRTLPSNEQATKVDKAVKAGEDMQVGPGLGATDWRRMRGLPILTRGIGGTLLGSRPEREVLKVDK